MNFKIPIVNSIVHFFEKRAFGVSDWWGEKLNIDPILIRKFFIYLSFATLGSPILIYFIMLIVFIFCVSISTFIKENFVNVNHIFFVDFTCFLVDICSGNVLFSIFRLDLRIYL